MLILYLTYINRDCVERRVLFWISQLRTVHLCERQMHYAFRPLSTARIDLQSLVPCQILCQVRQALQTRVTRRARIEG